jgi:glycosyltransferase involved in cell wall biosynthesis
MKILQVAPYFRPYPGGQEKYVYNLSKYLKKMGHEVHVITSNFPKGTPFEEIDGITVERHNILVKIFRTPITPGFLKIKHIMKEYDIVHIHNVYTFSSMLSTYFKLNNDVPLIITCHGLLKVDRLFIDFVGKIYDNSVGKIIFRTVDQIVTLSQSDAKYISSFTQDDGKIIILPNAIDVDDFKPYISKNRSDFLQKYKIEKKKIILFVGQIIPRKGIEYLIKAIQYITKTHLEKDIVCLIVGKGEYTKKLKEMVRKLDIEEFVRFTGELPFNELVLAYESAYIFVLPSLAEGLPTTILEAMYFEVPVIATDLPGIRDHFKDIALLIPQRNDVELAKSLIKLLDDHDLAHALGKAGKELVTAKYTWDIVASQYIKIYNNLISDHLKR